MELLLGQEIRLRCDVNFSIKHTVVTYAQTLLFRYQL